MPNKESQCPFLYSPSKAGCQSVRKWDDQYHLLFTMPRTSQRETGIMTPPPVYLPLVYLTSSHVTTDQFSWYMYTSYLWLNLHIIYRGGGGGGGGGGTYGYTILKYDAMAITNNVCSVLALYSGAAPHTLYALTKTLGNGG